MNRLTTGLVVAGWFSACAAAASGAVLVDYRADALPGSPWVYVSNGPSTEISQHTVFAQSGVLHMIDNACLWGNTLGYYQRPGFDPSRVITVEFRTRVLSGQRIGRSGAFSRLAV